MRLEQQFVKTAVVVQRAITSAPHIARSLTRSADEGKFSKLQKHVKFIIIKSTRDSTSTSTTSSSSCSASSSSSSSSSSLASSSSNSGAIDGYKLLEVQRPVGGGSISIVSTGKLYFGKLSERIPVVDVERKSQGGLPQSVLTAARASAASRKSSSRRGQRSSPHKGRKDDTTTATEQVSPPVQKKERGKVRVIFKTRDDLRQDMWVMQSLSLFQLLWADMGLRLPPLRTYSVWSLGADVGVIQFSC